MICRAEDLCNCQTQTKDGDWVPAKPIGAPGMTFWMRIVGAWLVLLGHAAAVRWE